MSEWQSDFAEWQTSAGAVRARADRVRISIVDRARSIAREAGLDSRAPFHHAHNASVSAHYGRPWRDVDYSAVRLILRLERLSWEPHRIADRVNERAYLRLMETHAPDAPVTKTMRARLGC